MGRMRQCQFFMSKSQSKLIVLRAREVEVRNAFLQMDRGNLGPRVAQGKLRKLDQRVRSDSQRTAVFEFHFGATLIPGTQLHTLGDGQVQESLLIALSGIAVDLDVALNFAQS